LNKDLDDICLEMMNSCSAAIPFNASFGSTVAPSSTSPDVTVWEGGRQGTSASGCAHVEEWSIIQKITKIEKSRKSEKIAI
jgi:hypothetical protein